MRIKEPIFSKDVLFVFPEAWCKNRAKFNNRVICCAHLHEERVFTCNFTTESGAELKCIDFEKANEL